MGKKIFFLTILLIAGSSLQAQNFLAGEHTVGISRLGIAGTLRDPLTGGAFFRPVIVMRYGYNLQDYITIGSDVGADLALVNNSQSGGTLVWTGIFRPYARAQMGSGDLSFFLEGGAGINYRFWNISSLSPWVYQLQALVGVTYRPAIWWSLDIGIGYGLRYEVNPGFWYNGSVPRLGFNLHFQ